VELFDLTFEGKQKQPHQCGYFFLRSTPVFTGKGEQRQDLDTLAGTGFHHRPY
jgi:hypothetical protein